MPNGEENVTNSVLEMMHADRHTVGHYRCLADNRVGQSDVRDISVNVLCKSCLNTLKAHQNCYFVTGAYNTLP